MLHKILVPDMHCEKCAERINRALNEIGIKFLVDLNTKTVTINGCEHCLNTALTELEDLGFSPKTE